MKLRDRSPNRGGPPSRARFFRAVGPGSELPETHRREVLFCGRSNVGKSSLLNGLTGVRGLARTSRTPGRTREIHFYEQGTDRFLVDLPGYGYAKVSIAARREWSDMIESYLDGSARIVLAIVLVDSRHPPFDSDRALTASLDSRKIPYVVALTKTDKLGSAGRAASLRGARGALPGAIGWVATSAKTSAGIADLARWVDDAVSSGKVALLGRERGVAEPGELQ